jgi:hypothetical protein
MLTSCLKSINALFRAQSVIKNFSKFKPEYFEKWNQQISESNKINEKRIARLISDMKFILRLPKSETGVVDEVSNQLKASICLEENFDPKELKSLLKILKIEPDHKTISRLENKENLNLNLGSKVFKKSLFRNS